MAGLMPAIRVRIQSAAALQRIAAHALVALVFSTGGHAVAQVPLAMSEEAAIRTALSRIDFQEMNSNRLVAAESAVAEVSVLPNPVIGFDRESVGTSGGRASETSVVISQTLDISGRRALRREAAGARVEIARLENRQQRSATVAAVRRAYADALFRQRSQVALQEWLTRVETTAATVTRLAQGGEASGYDRRRMSREAQTARARVESSHAELARALETLAGSLGQPVAQDMRVSDDLLPAEPPPLETYLVRLDTRPDLEHLQAQARAFEHDRAIAERAWIPDVTIGVGHKRVDEPGRSDNGYIVNASIAIPIFDRNQAGAQRARAQAAGLWAERNIQLSKAKADLSGVWRQARELRSAAERLRSTTGAEARDLSRIAETSYRGGEGSILELLDAYRTELDMQTTIIDLELRARIARIELDTIAGVDPHE